MNSIILAPIFCLFFCIFITDGSEIATINESCEGKIILRNATLKSCQQAGGKCCVSFSGQDENSSGKKISSLPTMLKMLKESTSSNYECSQCWDEYSGIFEIDGEIFAHYNWMNGRFGRK